MRKSILFLCVLFIIAAAVPAYGVAQSDGDLFTEAKILIFDKQWEKAQKILEEILEDHPDSRYYTQALFYKGKCLEEQKGKDADAIAVYERFLRQNDASDNLKEEAENSIVDLAIRLFENGKRAYLGEAEKRLQSSNRVIRYYAAIQLSFVKDQRASESALPVLKEILEKTRDEELRNRAKLAILRIDPDAFEEFGEEADSRGAKVMYIRIYQDGLQRPSLKLNIPWALADLAFAAISKEDKTRIREQGYNLDKIVRQLLEMRGEVLEIYDAVDGVTIKIWIK